MEAFQKALPPGAMNFVSGRGRDTMPVLMETGKVDALAFIGGSGAADSLIRQHPHPHRLKIFLQLEAKNMGIFLPDLFREESAEELSKAVEQSVLGGKIHPSILLRSTYLTFGMEALNTFFLYPTLSPASLEFQWTALHFAKALLHPQRPRGRI